MQWPKAGVPSDWEDLEKSNHGVYNLSPCLGRGFTTIKEEKVIVLVPEYAREGDQVVVLFGGQVLMSCDQQPQIGATSL